MTEKDKESDDNNYDSLHDLRLPQESKDVSFDNSPKE